MKNFLCTVSVLAVSCSLSANAYAGAKGSTYAGQVLALMLNGTGVAGLAQNAGTPFTNLCLAFHTADPGAGGTQSTNEAAYPGYTRELVARSSSGFTVSGTSATLTSPVSFPTNTGNSSETESWFSLGEPIGGSCSGAAEILYRGPLSPSILVSNGGTPQMTTVTVISEQ